MFGYLLGVFGLLFANFWFMAGQRMVLQALAWYEPTSCVMEWLHDAVFGISEDRMAIAQHTGKKARMKDGKTYVQMVVPRRKVPYPLSFGGTLHLLFFNVDDQFDSDQVVQQVLRSTMILSVAVLLVQTSIMDWMFGADALFSDARTLQQQGNIDAAVDNYMTVLKQDPLHNPHVAAIHFSLLSLQNAWAAGLYLVAATFHAEGDTAQAIQHYATVLQHAPDCVLASHALRSLQAGGDAPSQPEPLDGGAPLEYVRAAFDGYAGSYDAAMSRLSYRAPDLLAEVEALGVSVKR
jgi:tetratricopeptide (TPR) repeat protein